MTINDDVKPFVRVLYNTLRECKPNFRPEEYKWRLGGFVICELDSTYNMGITEHMLFHKDEKATLYGIEIEIDRENPYNVQLFEDITNKIAVKKSLESEGTFYDD